MQKLVRNSLILSVLVGLGAAVGCSSSDSSSGGGAGAGGSHAGSGGSAGKGGNAAAGATSGGNAGEANGGESSGGDNGGTPGGAPNGGGAGEPAGGDTSGPNSSGGEAGAAGPQACNDLTYSGTTITISNNTGVEPTLTYGALQAGDYRLTSGAIYSATSQTTQIGESAHVSITNQTATIDLVTNGGIKTELAIVMAQPNSLPPTSVKVICSGDPVLSSVAGQESKDRLQYGVTSTTFSVYEVPLKTLLTFTLVS